MPLLDRDAPVSRETIPSNYQQPNQNEVLAALDGLVGEQVFPVATGDGIQQPGLIALDASGTPMVVEIIGYLDNIALLRSLNHAGAAGRMSRGQMAANYAGGLGAFTRDLQEYLNAVPFRRAATGNRGARLVIICTDADPQVLNAIDFLNRPELPIKVLRADTLETTDGHRFIDVSPLVVNPSSAPEHPELVGQTGVSRLRISAVDREGYHRAALTEPQLAPSEPVATETFAPEPIVEAPASPPTERPTSGKHQAAPSEPVRFDIWERPAKPSLSRKARRLALEASAGPTISAPAETIETTGTWRVNTEELPASEIFKQQTAPPISIAVLAEEIEETPPESPVLELEEVTPVAPPSYGSRRQRRLAEAEHTQQRSYDAAAVLTPQPPEPHFDPSPPPVAISPTEIAIARAKAALAAASTFQAPAPQPVQAHPRWEQYEQHASELMASGGAPVGPSEIPSRRGSRAHSPEQDAAREGIRPYRSPIEFTGVFAKGTDAADPLSWDTTTLPVIARPITTAVPRVNPPSVS